MFLPTSLKGQEAHVLAISQSRMDSGAPCNQPPVRDFLDVRSISMNKNEGRESNGRKCW